MKSHNIRLKLLREGVKQHQCERCGLTDWLGKPIPLELDHIDGNHSNNALSNLQVLCCNCHAQTPTWRGRKLKKPARSYICQLCFKAKVSRINLRCRSCASDKSNKTKINWPDTQTLLSMIKASSYRQVGVRLGVTDNAVRKRIMRYP